MKKTALQISKLVLIFLFFATYSCSEDADVLMNPDDEEAVVPDEDASSEEETTAEENNNSTSCTDPNAYIFNEKDGLVFVEFENAEFSTDWKLKSDGDTFTGTGYMVWEGPQHLNNPGNGTVTYTIKISNTGTYRFLWYSAVKTGDSSSDHNDSWLRFSDASDFYAQKNDSRVYPKGIDKTPNPDGASAEGWFKIYRSGSNLDFKWQASTFDNNGHNIFVQFDTPGTYLMEVSARSSGHGIDKFVLFNDAVSQAMATSNTAQSAISCE